MSFKMAIDAGHGLFTAGKRCLASLDANETREWTLNSRIAGKLQNLLSVYDVEIVRIDDPTGAIDVSLADRCAKANSANVDLYLSIHHNSGANGTQSGGLEVYRHSSVEQSSETGLWQSAIYDALISAGIAKGNRSEPKKTADFQVLRNTKMIAVLCEMGYMDSVVDTPLILTEEFANKAAQGFCDCLVSKANLAKLEVQPAPQPNGNNNPPAVDPDASLPYAIYQVYTKANKWLPNVVDDSNFAGVKTRPIQALYVNISEGSVLYQVHTIAGKWLPWVTDRKDYAGVLGKNIDAVRVKLAGAKNYSVQCRVAPIGQGYYPWVTDNNDFAGVIGKAIDRIQIRIISK